MKLKKHIAIFLSAGILLLNACQKDIDVFVPDPGQINGPDTNWVSGIADSMLVSNLKNDLELNAQEDSTDISSGSSATVLYSSGLHCSFVSNSLLFPSNRPATGKIKIGALFLKTKGDMIKMNKPTISSDGNVLISGGAVFIQLKSGDSILHIAPSAGITLGYPSASILTAGKLFYGYQSGNIFNWILTGANIPGYVTASLQGYEIKTSQVGWVSPAQVYQSSEPKTIVTADLPPYFTNANTSVFLVFKNMLSVICMYGNSSTKKFSSIPVATGNDVTVVVISKQGNDFYLGHKDTVTALPSSTSVSSQSVAITPIKVSIDDIRFYLESL